MTASIKSDIHMSDIRDGGTYSKMETFETNLTGENVMCHIQVSCVRQL